MEPSAETGPANAPAEARSWALWWRERRLRIGTLAPATQAWAALALLTCAASGLSIAALGAGWQPPGGVQVIGNDVGVVPRVAVLATFLGRAVALAVVAAGTAFPGWRLRWLTLAGIALIGAAVAGGTVGAADVVEGFFPGAHPFAPLVTGWLGVASAVGLLVVAGRWRGRAMVLAALAAAPMLLCLLGYAAVGGTALLERPDILARDVVGSAVVTVAIDMGAAVGLLFLWGLVESVRQARDIGLAAVRITKPAAWVVGAAVVAKLVWLAAGYSDRLPGWLGGSSEGWPESRENGAVGWVLAVAMVTAAALWVVRPRDPMDETEGIERPSLAMVLGASRSPSS